MNIRAFLIIGLALVCGISAAWGVKQFRNPVEVKIEPETTPVLVAAGEIPRGQVLSESDVRVRPWPKEMVPPGTLTRPEEAVDRSAMIQLLEGEPILDAKLANREAGRGLAVLIPKGMRAYTISTAKAPSNVAGFVMPGNRVDVLLNLRGNANDETGGGSTTTLLQSVEILAVNQELDAPADNRLDTRELSSVTLLVTPDQAALLDLGQNMGQLTLALRNPEDGDTADTMPATIADIRFRQEKPAGPAVPSWMHSLADAAVEWAKRKPGPADQPAPSDEPSRIVTLRGGQRGEIAVVARTP
jgi:pilus assembly protein CpaB